MAPDLSDFVQAPPPGVFRLSKTETANAELTSELTLRISGNKVVAATWAINESTVPSWLSLPLVGGTIGATEKTRNLSITASTVGLPESSNPYTAALSLSLNVASQGPQSFLVPITLYVSAPTLAHTSIWGRPITGTSVCQVDALSDDDSPIEARLGSIVKVPFTACDFQGLAVDHVDNFEGKAVIQADAGRFDATLTDQSTGANHSLQLDYDLVGTYEVLLQAQYLGKFWLRLIFTSASGTSEQVGVDQAVQAICPDEQTELSSSLLCGCAAGDYLDENAQLCEPCPVGEYCAEGVSLGARCPVGLTTDGRGAKSPDECGCPTGTYESAAADGAIDCKPCNRHMDCIRTGLTLATVPLLPSRWRLSNRTASVYECTSSACLGGEWNGTTSDEYCAQGYEGPRCEWCSDPDRYYDDAISATCKACGDMVSYAFRQIVILLAIAVALGILRAAVLRAPRLLVRTSRRLAQAATSMQQFMGCRPSSSAASPSTKCGRCARASTASSCLATSAASWPSSRR